MLDSIDVLYEDNHLLAVYKPAGALTMGDDTGDPSMVDAAADYLRMKYNKPGNVYVGVVHRLDRPVSGVLLLARTSKASSRLSDQFRRRTVRKTYRAIVESMPRLRQAELTDWLKKDRGQNLVSVVSADTPGAQESRLRYEVLAGQERSVQLKIEPLTGRSHQIRVQLASRGMPILGDVKYGSKHRQGGRISLHAEALEFEHPTKKERLTVTAPVPIDL